jgi:hypothetical protein
VARLSLQKRWQLRAFRHLVIQTAGFVIGIIIAVVCAIAGNWIEAGVVAFNPPGDRSVSQDVRDARPW